MEKNGGALGSFEKSGTWNGKHPGMKKMRPTIHEKKQYTVALNITTATWLNQRQTEHPLSSCVPS
jgi:hypothetical protein